MNNQTEQITDLDQTDEDILTYEVSDDALEAARVGARNGHGRWLYLPTLLGIAAFSG
jgi:hypothetical protein